MDLQLNDIENSKKELTAELSYEELTPYFEKAMESYRKKANIPGFRKGKVPMNMIKKLYGEGLEYSAIEDITNEVFVKYIMDNKLDLLSKAYGQLKEQIRKIIVGQDDVIEQLLIALFSQGHVLLEGVPGPVSYTHLRAHETPEHLVCRLLLEKQKTIR